MPPDTVAYIVLPPAPTKAHGPRMPLTAAFVVVIDPLAPPKATMPPTFCVIDPKASKLPAAVLLIVDAGIESQAIHGLGGGCRGRIVEDAPAEH